MAFRRRDSRTELEIPFSMRSPMPSMPKPIVTNRPKNGIATQRGTSSPLLLSLNFASSSGVRTCCFSTTCEDAADAVANAAGIIAVAESRRELFADDLAGEAVGQHALEAIADLDAHLALVRRDQDQDAVILLGLTDAPLLEQPGRVLLDRHAIERRHGRDGDFGGRPPLEADQARDRALLQSRGR